MSREKLLELIRKIAKKMTAGTPIFRVVTLEPEHVNQIFQLYAYFADVDGVAKVVTQTALDTSNA